MTWRSASTNCSGPTLIVSFSSLPVKRYLVVLVVHRRARVDADVEGLVNDHEERNRVRDLLAGDVLAVHLQDTGAALAKAGSVVFEVEYDSVLAR